MILFEEIEHKYFEEDCPEEKWLSVSGLFDLVKKKFDTKERSEAYSNKGKEWILKDLVGKWEISHEEAFERWGHLEFTPEDIRNIWNSKADIGKARGTMWHKEIEQRLLNNGGIKGSHFQGKYNKSIDLFNLKKGDYIELIIPYPELKLVGTADRVKILDNHKFIIRDWKTDKELKYQGTAYYDKKSGTKKVQKLLPPLSHIDDVNGNHYNIKESLYIYFLEQYGYEFEEGWIDHVIFDGDEGVNIVEYPITYMKKEVKNLLSWYKEKHHGSRLSNQLP